MKKTIGVLAHVDAGKTTFCEQVLYHTNSIRNRGRVDHRDAFLDNHEIEKERGITIFSDQGVFEFKDSTYYLVDTPGHIDFSSEMERAIGIMDYAIIIVSAVEGIQGHTKTVWKLLRKYNVPSIFFINKLDRVGADENRVLNEIKKELSKNICYLETTFNNKNNRLTEQNIELISEYDDELLEIYINGLEYDENLYIDKLKRLIKESKVFPCFSGSALQDEGVKEFLDGLDELTYTEYKNEKKFSAYIYKIRYEENGTKVTFMKALNGKIKVKDEIDYGNNKKEKINSIRIYNGNKFKSVDYVEAGDLFGVTGISKGVPGTFLGNLNGEKTNFEIIPTLMSKVIINSEYNPREVLGYLKILEAEDPSLNIIWNEPLQELHVHIMGKIQLEVLKEIAERRFNLKIEFGPCKILYKETIEEEGLGSGHFEPLRHYAEVHLKIEPLKRNSGILFESKCHTDNLSIGQQNLIKTHIFEKDHHGILTGSPITDIKFTLLIGKDHNKHTCGGDFREATFRAIRQGLEKVKNILLEPYYKFIIEVPSENIGRVLIDIQRLYGIFDPPEINGDSAKVNGRGPVATFMDYSMDVIAFTKGKGNITLMFDGYDICHNQDEVIENVGYNKNADIEYTSTSVFCSHGQGYLVEWDKADEKMHCNVNI